MTFGSPPAPCQRTRSASTIKMYPLVATLALLASLGSVLAVPTSHLKYYRVKERHTVPAAWTAVSRPDPHRIINLQIGLKQRNMDKLEQDLLEVSDPDHARYGQYLSAGEVHELIAPTNDTVDLISDLATRSRCHCRHFEWYQRLDICQPTS